MYTERATKRNNMIMMFWFLTSRRRRGNNDKLCAVKHHKVMSGIRMWKLVDGSQQRNKELAATDEVTLNVHFIYVGLFSYVCSICAYLVLSVSSSS